MDFGRYCWTVKPPTGLGFETRTATPQNRYCGLTVLHRSGNAGWRLTVLPHYRKPGFISHEIRQHRITSLPFLRQTGFPPLLFPAFPPLRLTVAVVLRSYGAAALRACCLPCLRFSAAPFSRLTVVQLLCFYGLPFSRRNELHEYLNCLARQSDSSVQSTSRLDCIDGLR